MRFCSRPRLLMALILILAAGARGQIILQPPAGPVQPGVPFTVTLTNNSSTCIDTMVTNVLTLLQPTGELVAPELVGCGPVSFCLSNGQVASLSYTTPATGPGSSGSFVLMCPYGSGAAVRLDVGVPSVSFPAIHTYPTAIPHGPGGHQVAYPATAGSEWEFANTTNQAQLISPTILIFTPGGAVPVAFTTFSSLFVPANGVTRVSLPLAGIPSGPYTVETIWVDPAMGSSATVKHGIQLGSGVMVDLHLPGGHVLVPGGTIEARIALNEAGFFTTPTWSFALAVGFLPGSTPLPGGVIVPLVPDLLVMASISDGVGGLITGNVGLTTTQSVYCAQSSTSYPVATGIQITHPGPPSLGGLTVRLGALAIEPLTGQIAASQPEEITFQ